MVEKRPITEIHKPVLFDDCVRLITENCVHSAAQDGRDVPIIVDCTLGLAGHTSGFLSQLPQVRVIGIDRDEEALELATRRVSDQGFADRFTPIHAAFDDFSRVLEQVNVSTVDAVFMDLGLSSLQIDETERGFSYSHDAPLDMRMDSTQSLTAEEVLRTYEVSELIRIFKEYGEERFSGPIAREIVRLRDTDEFIHTSSELTALVDRVVPKAKRPAGNPAKRIFQALRIEVNGELEKLSNTLPQALTHLCVGGRLVVESYHSLEDKTVKKFMSRGLHANVPQGLPVIPEDAQPFLRDLTRGALKADEQEITQNSRSASVRLRAVQLERAIPQSARDSLADSSTQNSTYTRVNHANTSHKTVKNTKQSKGNYGRR